MMAVDRTLSSAHRDGALISDDDAFPPSSGQVVDEFVNISQL